MTAYQQMFAAWYDRAMARYETYIAQRKQRLFADLSGTVLEIGPGTGANLPHLPRGCRWIGVEPNPHMRAPLSQRLDRLDLEAEIQPVAAEDLQAADGSIDAVIATLTLCSVRRPQRVLDRDRLLELVSGRSLGGVFDRSIDVQISRLRRKIEQDPSNPTLIKTIRNGGYILAEHVNT